MGDVGRVTNPAPYPSFFAGPSGGGGLPHRPLLLRRGNVRAVPWRAVCCRTDIATWTARDKNVVGRIANW